MSSGLILRYAHVSHRPLREVEREWRAIKQEHRKTGRKKDYVSAVKVLRERLGLKHAEGRRAYLKGENVPVEVLAETPEFALIQIEDTAALANPELKRVLFGSHGIMTVPYEHLVSEQIGVGLSAPTGLNTPTTDTTAQTGITGARPGVGGGAPGIGGIDPLQGIVQVYGKKAVVVSRVGQNARVRFLDTKDEANVNISMLKPVTSLSASRVWRSLEPSLTETQKRHFFAAILKLEHSISYLPPGLQEDLENLAPSPDDAHEQTPPEPDYGRGPADNYHDDRAKQGGFEFDMEDWRLIFDQREHINPTDRSEEDEAEERNPMPGPPSEEPVPPGEGIAGREGPPASKGIKPASDEEVHDMLQRMKTARESYEAQRGKLSDRPKVSSLLMEAERLQPDGKAQEEPKSIMEKNLERAKQWDALFEGR